ncbi:hypothetical protein NC651_034028 [Populus alba x Populus x berolinensis]|nr:hypothetical protein NC651_034028 [Populus alba x Populus x berolinensis]
MKSELYWLHHRNHQQLLWSDSVRSRTLIDEELFIDRRRRRSAKEEKEPIFMHDLRGKARREKATWPGGGACCCCWSVVRMVVHGGGAGDRLQLLEKVEKQRCINSLKYYLLDQTYTLHAFMGFFYCFPYFNFSDLP